jgi:hypothetical protein
MEGTTPGLVVAARRRTQETVSALRELDDEALGASSARCWRAMTRRLVSASPRPRVIGMTLGGIGAGWEQRLVEAISSSEHDSVKPQRRWPSFDLVLDSEVVRRVSGVMGSAERCLRTATLAGRILSMISVIGRQR